MKRGDSTAFNRPAWRHGPASGGRTHAIRRASRVARFPAADDFIQYYLASRFAAAVSQLADEVRAAMEADARAALGPFVGPQGLAFPMTAHVATVTR